MFYALTNKYTFYTISNTFTMKKKTIGNIANQSLWLNTFLEKCIFKFQNVVVYCENTC